MSSVIKDFLATCNIRPVTFLGRPLKVLEGHSLAVGSGRTWDVKFERPQDVRSRSPERQMGTSSRLSNKMFRGRFWRRWTGKSSGCPGDQYFSLGNVIFIKLHEIFKINVRQMIWFYLLSSLLLRIFMIKQCVAFSLIVFRPLK